MRRPRRPSQIIAMSPVCAGWIRTAWCRPRRRKQPGIRRRRRRRREAREGGEDIEALEEEEEDFEASLVVIAAPLSAGVR